MILAAFLLGISMNGKADATQKVTIADEAITGEVKSLSFEGDNVAITFANGSTQTVDMGKLSIAISYADISGIADIKSDEPHDARGIYNLAGQYVGNEVDALDKGIYIRNGKKIVVK